MTGNSQTSLGEDFGSVGSDAAERASANEFYETEGLLRSALSNVRSGIASRVQCVLCETKIPAARRRAIKGVETCIKCQREVENGTAELPSIESGDAWERAEDISDDDMPEVEI